MIEKCSARRDSTVHEIRPRSVRVLPVTPYARPVSDTVARGYQSGSASLIENYSVRRLTAPIRKRSRLSETV